MMMIVMICHDDDDDDEEEEEERCFNTTRSCTPRNHRLKKEKTCKSPGENRGRRGPPVDIFWIRSGR